MPDLIDRLSDEADLCRNEGATDIANLLDEARAELSRLQAAGGQGVEPFGYVDANNVHGMDRGTIHETTIARDPRSLGHNDATGCVAVYLNPVAADPSIDVRTILLDIVPGDGNGQEVYAKTVDDVVDKLTELAERLEAANPPAAPALVPLIARQRGEWHEDDGPVMWWAWNGHEWAGEPAWCGQPTDSDWPGYHTHWTPHQKQPVGINGLTVGGDGGAA